MGCDLIDSCGDTGPRCRERPRARRVKRGGYCEALVYGNSGWGLETFFHDVMVSTFKFGGNRIFFGVDTADFVG